MLKRWAAVCPRAMEMVTAAATARVAEAAKEHCVRAKARAPVETGALRNSISAKADGLTATVTADCPYAAAVEFGTSRRAPQPFMRG